MIQCSRCGTQLQGDLKVCTKCGTSVESETASQNPKRKRSRTTTSIVFIAIGAVAMIAVAIGSALHWATGPFMVESGKYSVGGLSTDGVITLALSILAVGLFIIAISGRAKWVLLVASSLSLSIFLIAIYDAVHIERILPPAADALLMTVGIGLKICIIAAAIGFVSGIGGFLIPKKLEIRTKQIFND